jgi:uracil-DNA glycosylase family 4
MPTRDDVLEELGLTPVWRLRADRGGAIPDVAVAPPPVVDSPRVAAAPPGTAPAIVSAPAVESTEVVDGREQRIATLEWRDFAGVVDACTACGLAAKRTRSVPGVGDVDAEWLFVGEAPGADEDARGEPFVGQAGKLLDSMLAALDLARGRNVYIANVLKCRPPNNRTPEPREVEACRPFLDRQITLIRPKLIVALGKSAATTLLGSDATIASLRGRLHRYRGVPLVVTYHPAYLLRSLADKAKAWEDLLFARRTLRAAQDAAKRAGADEA